MLPVDDSVTLSDSSADRGPQSVETERHHRGRQGHFEDKDNWTPYNTTDVHVKDVRRQQYPPASGCRNLVSGKARFLGTPLTNGLTML